MPSNTPKKPVWYTSLPPRTFLFLAVSAAFLIRIIVVAFVYRDLPDAPLHYEQFGWEIGWTARAIALGHGFSSPYYPFSGPTAMVPPLYTYLLAGIFRLFGVYTLTSGFIILALNSLFSALTCIPIYFSAKFALSLRAARLAACIWAVYPFAIFFSAGRVWEYALTSLLFTTTFCIAQRIHLRPRYSAWLGFGALYGLTLLSNPSVLTVFPFLLLIALWKLKNSRWLHGTFACLGLVIVIAPWCMRNYRELHVLTPVRDNAWTEIWAGNNGDTFAPNIPSTHPASNPVEMQRFLAVGETNYIAEKHELAVNFIRSHPALFLRYTVHRFVFYWAGYWSLSRAYRDFDPTEPANIFHCTVLTLLMLLGVRRFWRFGRAAALPYLVLIAVFPLTYYLSHPAMDYRQPIEPAIVILIAAAFTLRKPATLKSAQAA